MKRKRQSHDTNDINNDTASSDVEHCDSEETACDDLEGFEREARKLSPCIKDDLHDVLCRLRPSEDFATTGNCPVEVNPCIWIFGLGVVGLPLSERDAELIVNVSMPAPYGLSTETNMDKSVRQTWELKADEFELKNPRWGEFVTEVLDRVLRDLAVPSGLQIEAKLHKLLLSEKGEMFEELPDLEEEPGMFGTLAICLPSKHEGGEVHLTHRGQTKILETAGSSKFTSTYLCWYSDIKLEATEVTTGY